jgi:biopolymer transport protein TolR
MAGRVGGGRRQSGDGYRPMADINVTPFVDVMLVLLIIFMVTTPMLVAGVQVDLPETDSAPMEGQDEPLVVTIDKNAKIFLMDQPLDKKALLERLKALTKEKKDTRIFVRGDRAVDYGKVVEIVGTLSSAGYTKVALVTEVAGE